MTDEHGNDQLARQEPRPADLMPATLVALQQAIGRTFATPALLLEAVTHRSYVHEHPGPGVTSNERLEFLGDAVLALLSAQLLYEQFPGAPEGDLTAMRAALVRASTLAELARDLDLGSSLRLGKGEQVTGGRERDLLLASALEAVVGAVYRDGGIDATRQFVEPRLQMYVRERHPREYRDDKSLLQEAVQAQLGVTPTYRVVSSEGPAHDPHFVVEVLVGERAIARGEGRSKRQAEQDAAKAALQDSGWQVERAAPDATDLPPPPSAPQ